jgi:hypothetical protein
VDALDRAPPRDQQGDFVASALVSPAGGTIEVEGRATVVFGAGVFDRATEVTVATTGEPGTEGGQLDYYLLGGGPKPPFLGPPDGDAVTEPPPMSFDVQISGGRIPSGPIQVTMVVPDDYLATVPDGFTPKIFVELESGGAQELHGYYDILDSEFDPATGLVRARVTSWIERVDGFQANLLVGSRKD